MLPYLAAALIGGAFFSSKTRPASKHKKKTALGPRSGITYEVDDFPAAGLVLVRASDGSAASFARALPPATGFQFVRGSGNPRVVELIKKDFEP